MRVASTWVVHPNLAVLGPVLAVPSAAIVSYESAPLCYHCKALNCCCLMQEDLIPTCRELGIGIVACQPTGAYGLRIPTSRSWKVEDQFTGFQQS